jgi:malonyl-CoA O-methyltransferase
LSNNSRYAKIKLINSCLNPKQPFSLFTANNYNPDLTLNHKISCIEENIIASFSKYAHSYDRYAILQKSMAERLATYLPDRAPSHILELGCGTGIFTRHLLNMSINKLTLNDISPVMIDTLKSRFSVPSNTKYLTGNAEKIFLGKTDLICANAVFQWFLNPILTLTHLKNSLNKTGSLIFSTFGSETLMEFRETANLNNHITLYSLKQWKKFIKSSGYTINSIHVEKRKIFSTTTLNLMKNLQQIGAAPVRVLNTGELRKLIRDYDKRFGTEQGIYATWELLYFSISI